MYWVALAACSADGADPEGSETAAPSPDEAPSLCPACNPTEPVQLGGETQEFDGGRPVFLIVSRTPRPLTDPALAPLLARVEGTHELTFRWRGRFVESGIGGHDPVTHIVLDVHALRAFDVRLDSADHPSTVHLELAIDLRTEDGSMRGSIVHTLDANSALVVAGSDELISDELGTAYPLGDFRGSLDLALDPAREVAAALNVELLFSGQGVRGQLTTFVRYPPDRFRRVLEGVFPDDGCDVQEWPVPLDITLGAFAEHRLIDSFDAVAAALNRGPLQPPTGPARPELTLELGAADHACKYWPSIASVHAPIRLQSGTVDLQQEARIEFHSFQPGLPRVELLTDPPFIRAERLYALTGIPQMDIAAGADVAPKVRTTFTDTGGFEGILGLDILAGNQRIGRSWLGWCEGDGCY